MQAESYSLGVLHSVFCICLPLSKLWFDFWRDVDLQLVRCTRSADREAMTLR